MQDDLPPFKSRYPALVVESFLDQELYNKLEVHFKEILSFSPTNSFGQAHRENVIVTERNLENYRGLFDECVGDLFRFLDDEHFKKYLARQLAGRDKRASDSDKIYEELRTCDVEVAFAVAGSGYENPFHVDTAKRFIHGLIYFKTHNYTGGELELALPKNQDWSECDQIPFLSALDETHIVAPIDNLGVVVLSTPNSYHRGCKTEGERLFVYFAYNSSRIGLWRKNASFANPLNFTVGRFKQKHPLIFGLLGRRIVERLTRAAQRSGR
ncbi:MAG: hypothetical protein QNJ62_14170 [Methyloceanibacter sp.]|nr:hypothetical protein [Methyloceanibacter sp.]